MKSSFLLRICQAACVGAFFFLLTHSGLVLFYAGKGLSAWAASVVPVLLPFIILSKFWICYDIPSLLFRAAEKFVPGKQYAALSAALFLLGLSSGFPIGAVFVRHFYQQHIFDKKTAEILLPLCSFVSPMFLIGYIRPLTGFEGTEWNLFVLSVYLPLLFLFIKCFLFPKKAGRRDRHKAPVHPMAPADRKNVRAGKIRHSRQNQVGSQSGTEKKTASSIRDIWLSSLEIIFTIGIYMMLFSILFGLVLDEPSLRTPYMEILLSNLEITTGIAHAAGMPSLTGVVRGMVLAGITAAGGLCTAAQVYSTTFDCSFSMSRYLLIKGICALLSALLFGLSGSLLL